MLEERRILEMLGKATGVIAPHKTQTGECFTHRDPCRRKSCRFAVDHPARDYGADPAWYGLCCGSNRSSFWNQVSIRYNLLWLGNESTL